MFPNGPASWLDTNLTSAAFSPVLPGAGSGPKITAKFKSKVFSFADVVVGDNKLSLYQITEPLTSSSSATCAEKAARGPPFVSVKSCHHWQTWRRPSRPR